MISFFNVFKSFNKKEVINNISFKIKKGEIVGFVGPNGAGKTTTMRLILGYLKADSGEILVDNLNPVEKRLEILDKVGYLPENNPLYQDMKVKDYLDFVSKVKETSKLEKIFDDVGLNEVLEKKIEELSRGYKQRVGLAAALIGNPEILILDEPTSGLDPLEQEKIRQLIKKIAKNKIIIFSTHILSEVEDVANRLIIINQGKILYDGAKPKSKGAVEKLFKLKIKKAFK